MTVALPKLEDFADNFDPFTALLTIGGEGHITTPLAELSRLRREQGPVIEGDLHSHFGAPRQLVMGDAETYMVLSYEACMQVLFNAEVFSNTVYERHVGITFGRSITTMDPPIHTKYRRLFQSAFTPNMLGALKPRFEALIGRLIAQLRPTGKADLVSQLALHFPFQFICDLMDLPEADRLIFHKLAMGQVVVVFDPPHGMEASDKLGRYLSALIEQRRSSKSEADFVAVLANAEVDGERLPDDVLLGFFRQLMNAGGDTSFHGFSNILSALLTNPDQLEILRRDRSLIPKAIEEGLRWGAPITSIDRVTTRDTELFGVKIPKDSVVRVCIAAANRDEAQWPDPDRFDVSREPRRLAVFGSGAHVCIGQHLARMELQLALNALLDLPNIRLDTDYPLPVIHGLTFRGANAVHVKWDV